MTLSVFDQSPQENRDCDEDRFVFYSSTGADTSHFNHPDSVSKNLSVWVEEYGCSSSLNDSETIRGLLQRDGYGLGKSEVESSLNIIVTCSVKDTTEHRMLHRINELVSTGKPLIVAGCLPKANKNLVETKFPQVSMLGPQCLDKTTEVLRKTIAGQKAVALQESNTNKLQLPRLRINPVISIIEIASGCVSSCTFCQTKQAKGNLRSHRIGDIINRLKNDVQDGCKEIWLSSTDNGCYGRDLGSDLVELLEYCVTIKGEHRIRIGMMNPLFLPALNKRLINILSADNNLFKFLHIPFQSGSNSILRKMKRGHPAKVFVDSVKNLREKIPDATLATDVIVGFPTETDEDFEKTLEVISKTQPDIINISKFGARPGTTAAKLKKLCSETIKERTKRVHYLANDIGIKRNAYWLKWEGEIVINSHDTKSIQGRNYAYKPVHVASSGSGSIRLGDKLYVRIEEITSHILIGSIV